jgi:hypothetical protein
VGIYTKTPIKNPVTRHSSYPDQKPLHSSDISIRDLTLAPDQEVCLQVNGRTIILPILKLVPTSRGNLWTEAVGDLEIFYDEDLTNVFIRNVSPCTYRIRFKIV